jgi:hypothetical protein
MGRAGSGAAHRISTEGSVGAAGRRSMMSADFNPGVPLAHYRQHDGAVLLTSLDCVHRRTLPVEAVISRLTARGLGDEGTGLRAVAGFVREPCPRCGGSRFETRPEFWVGRSGAALNGASGR